MLTWRPSTHTTASPNCLGHIRVTQSTTWESPDVLKMRLPLLIPLLALATVVVGRPQCLRSVNAVDLNSPRALAVPAVHAQKRNALAHHVRYHISVADYRPRRSPPAASATSVLALSPGKAQARHQSRRSSTSSTTGATTSSQTASGVPRPLALSRTSSPASASLLMAFLGPRRSAASSRRSARDR